MGDKEVLQKNSEAFERWYLLNNMRNFVASRSNKKTGFRKKELMARVVKLKLLYFVHVGYVARCGVSSWLRQFWWNLWGITTPGQTEQALDR